MPRLIAVLMAAFLTDAAIAQQGELSISVEARETNFSVVMPGAAVDVKVKPVLSYQHRGDDLIITGSSTLDLSDLQRKLPSIVETLQLPKNNCERFASDNLVAAPTNSALVVANGTPTLSISGWSSIWACLQNPVPDTKVQWSPQQIAPGIQSQVPTVVTSAGAPIKTRLADTNFEWSAPLVWTQAGKIQPGSATINFQGTEAIQSAQYDRRLQWIDALNSRLVEQVSKTFGPLFNVSGIVPPSLVQKNPVIKSVQWIDQSGHLAAEVKWSATIPAAQESSLNNL